MLKSCTVFLAAFCTAPAFAGSLIFDNIGPNGGIFHDGFSTTSQLDQGFGFDAGVADDFFLPASSDPSGDWRVLRLNWSGEYIFGSPITATHFNIIFWPQDANDAKPAGSTPAGNPPDYSQALAIYNHVAVTSSAGGGGPNSFDYSSDLPNPFVAADQIPYWLEIQADHNWPPQWAWQVTAGTQGEITYNGFAGLLDTVPFWSENGLDTAFQLFGEPVPEPGSATLLLLSGLAVIGHRRR